MISIRTLGLTFGGVIQNYVDHRIANDQDPEQLPELTVLRKLITTLQNKQTPTKELITYSKSPILNYEYEFGTRNHFAWACGNGYLKLAQWIKETWTEINFRVDNDQALEEACFYCHLHVLRWLKATWPKINFRTQNITQSWFDAFCRASYSGNRELAEWIKETHPYIHTRINMKKAFYMVCLHGQLHMAKWLNSFSKIGLRTANMAMFWACCFGQLHVAKWLKKTWPRINLRTDNDKLFCVVCFHGHLKVAQWLKKTWPEINHLYNNNDAFISTNECGHERVIQWLKTLPNVYL